MVQEEDVLKALGNIIDPDLQKDIVSLGFIKNLEVKDTSVSFSIELTTPACPLKNQFKKQAEELVGKLPGVEKVVVEMTAGKTHHHQLKPLAGVDNIIAIASTKGGVGKSTIAAAIASEVAGRGYRVGLLDADIFGPSMPSLFHIHSPRIVESNGKLKPVEFGNLKLMSFGFLLGDAPAIMRGPMVSGYIQQLLQHVDWGELDYLFIDMPPGTGDTQLTISQTIQLDGAVIVTTRSNLSLVDVARGILMFEKVKVPMLGIIENMAYFVCDSCDKKHYIFGEKKSVLSDRFGLDTLAHIPLIPGAFDTFAEYRTHEVIQNMTDTLIRKIGAGRIRKKNPPRVNLGKDHIEFLWHEGGKTTIDYRSLRESCGCAYCVDEYSGEQLLNPKEIPNDIRALEVFPLGNYAVSVQWSDGHTSSIYPYARLKELNYVK